MNRLIIVTIFLVGSVCKVTAESKVTYLPYFDECSNQLVWVKEYLKPLDSSLSIQVIDINRRLVGSLKWDKFVKIVINSENQKSVDLAFSTFLLDCGPNSVISLPEDIRNKKKIREYISHYLGFLYDGPIKIGFSEDGELVAFYTRKL